MECSCVQPVMITPRWPGSRLQQVIGVPSQHQKAGGGTKNNRKHLARAITFNALVDVAVAKYLVRQLLDNLIRNAPDSCRLAFSEQQLSDLPFGKSSRCSPWHSESALS
jgi:hypothetical protein